MNESGLTAVSNDPTSLIFLGIIMGVSMRWLFLPLFLLLATKPALAWGPVGHKMTCDIAYSLLTPETKAKVDTLLEAQPSTRRNFASTCNYADQVKDTDGRRGQHFVNLNRASPMLPGLVCPVTKPKDHGKCLLSAIEEHLGILADHSRSAEDRSYALMYLGHWIGDLHQPLHISFQDDIGGGEIDTTGTCSPPKGMAVLHSIWDSCIINQRIFASGRNGDQRYRDTIAQLASVSASDKAAWVTGAPWEWANQSLLVTEATLTDYCTLKGDGSCWFDATHQTKPYKPTRGAIKIDAAYLNSNAPFVQTQLQKGGVRLAMLIEQAMK
jgi:hypothetical protein